MKNHPRRAWRRLWGVETGRATHACGLVVSFELAGFPAAGRALNGVEVGRSLSQLHGHAAAAQMMRRLLREAAEVYSKAQERTKHSGNGTAP